MHKDPCLPREVYHFKWQQWEMNQTVFWKQCWLERMFNNIAVVYLHNILIYPYILLDSIELHLFPLESCSLS